MRTFLFGMLVLATLAVAGCGGPSGPANPADTPVLTEQEVQNKMTQNAPADAKKYMESYKKGGGGGQRPR